MILTSAVLKTILYADLFDFPMTSREVQRYLIGMPASLRDVQDALDRLVALEHLSRLSDAYVLRGREGCFEIRRRRTEVSSQMWQSGLKYGQHMANLPFVRMVAVTGALSMNNAEKDTDIDFLVITEPGRLWLCRALVILLVRAAAREGIVICPNYFLSTRMLQLPERNLYSAHEMAQMVPLSGLPIYLEMRRLNPWVEHFLPNSDDIPGNLTIREPHSQWKELDEWVLGSPAGDWMEAWERRRKIIRFTPVAVLHPEAEFNPDVCKGHVNDHAHQVLNAYTERVLLYGRNPAWAELLPAF